jgi:hypothetical protein
VAIVVPDVVVVKQYAEYHGMEGTFSVLCSNAAIKQLIMDDMVRLGADAGLKSFEQVSLCRPSSLSGFLFPFLNIVPGFSLR